MNEENVTRPCLFCERFPAITWYGLCESCAAVRARRRVYRYGRGQTPAWEAHLLHLTERAKRRLPLFEEGYVSPQRPQRGRRKKRRRRSVPRLFHVTLPRKKREE